MFTPFVSAAAGAALVLGLLLVGFWAMARRVPQVVAMSALACALLALQGEAARNAAERGAGHFALLALVLTSVAIPAHMLDQSRAFLWIAAALGSRVGLERLRHPGRSVPVVTACLLALTFVTGGLLHGLTAALLMTPITIRLCASYSLPSRWLLCGEFVASNLGGFSTTWGDVASHFQAESWHLTQADFIREILFLNLVLLALLILAVSCLTLRTLKVARQDQVAIAKMIAAFLSERRELRIDRPLFWRAVAVLVPAIALPLLFPRAAVSISALAILAGIVLERPKARSETIKSLGVDIYLVLGTVLVVAECVASSELGRLAHQVVTTSGAATWSTMLTAYLGAAFTGPGSWAAAASARTAVLDPSHAAAWAVGSAICAGSSVCLNAALAGIVVADESRRIGLPDHVFTFGNYLKFGLPFSALMLGFYALALPSAGTAGPLPDVRREAIRSMDAHGDDLLTRAGALARGGEAGAVLTRGH